MMQQEPENATSEQTEAGEIVPETDTEQPATEAEAPAAGEAGGVAEEPASQKTVEELATKYANYAQDDHTSAFTDHGFFADIRRMARHILGEE